MTNATVPAPDEALRYPIGRFDFELTVTPEMRPGLMADFRRAPEELRQAVAGLDDSQLETPYRPGGWTVRQVVHHLADADMVCSGRFHLALTEDSPEVKAFDEARWAELADARSGPVSLSLPLVGLVRERMAALMSAMTDEQWKRTYRHSYMGVLPLDKVLALYVWHGKHHIAHITRLRERMNW